MGPALRTPALRISPCLSADEAACEPEGRPVLRPAEGPTTLRPPFRGPRRAWGARGAPALRSTASPLGAGSSSSGGGRAERGEGGRIRRPRPEVGRARLAEQSW